MASLGEDEIDGCCPCLQFPCPHLNISYEESTGSGMCAHPNSQEEELAGKSVVSLEWLMMYLDFRQVLIQVLEECLERHMDLCQRLVQFEIGVYNLEEELKCKVGDLSTNTKGL